MRTSRARFKYYFYFTRSIEDTAKLDALAKDLSDGPLLIFLVNVRKINTGNVLEAYTMVW